MNVKQLRKNTIYLMEVIHDLEDEPKDRELFEEAQWFAVQINKSLEED